MQGMNNIKRLLLKVTLHVYYSLLFCTLYVNFVA
jgi:hypothetical protein